MATAPKETEERMERMLNAWQTLAPAKSFGGMTLEQFTATVEAARVPRRRLRELEDEITQAQAERDARDETFRQKAQLIVNGVLADPTEGADSALYEAMGYTRRSNRKSGLTRPKNALKNRPS